MKKLLLITLIALSAHAGGVWDMIKNSTSDDKINTKQYTVEVAGTNVRAYVFDVPEMKSICTSIWGRKGDSHQLECKTYKEIGITK